MNQQLQSPSEALAKKLLKEAPSLRARFLNARIRAETGSGLTWKALLDIRRETARSMFKESPDLDISDTYRKVFARTLTRKYLKELSEEWIKTYPFKIEGAERNRYAHPSRKTQHTRFVWDPRNLFESSDWSPVISGYSSMYKRNYIHYQRNYNFVRLSNSIVRHYLSDLQSFARSEARTFRTKVTVEFSVTVVIGQKFDTKAKAEKAYRDGEARTFWFSPPYEMRGFHELIAEARQELMKVIDGRSGPAWLVAIKVHFYAD